MIDIKHSHGADDALARTIVESIAEKLSTRFEVEHRWQGDAVLLARSGMSGMSGMIQLSPGTVHVTCDLSFPLSMMKSMVESEIRRVLSEKLA